jgi:hypothetical protein
VLGIFRRFNAEVGVGLSTTADIDECDHCDTVQPSTSLSLNSPDCFLSATRWRIRY